MRYAIRVVSAITSALCLLISLALGSIYPEGYAFANPGIDTYYSPDYDEQRFQRIKVGDSVTSVISAIGQPINKQVLYDELDFELETGDTLWYYTSDGKYLKKGDYAWLLKGVTFDKHNHVKEISDGICFD